MKKAQPALLEPEAAAVSRQTPLHTGPIADQLLIRIPLEQIDPSPFNPRRHFDEQALEELAQSLGQDGQLQAIVLRPIGAGKEMRFSIVAGERRFRAAQRLGWKTIAATVRPELNEQAHARISLIENLARADLNPVEEAHGYQQLLDMGMTQEQVAEAVHRSRPAIANALRLLKAPEPVLVKVRDGQLQPSHVLPLLRYEKFPDIVVRIAEIAAERRTPSKDLEKGLGELGYDFTHRLIEGKLAVEVATYRAEFDVQSTCIESCPFGAYVPGQYTGHCLKPEHFRQLQKEVRDVRKAETQAAVAQAEAGGATVLKLSSLKYGQYERLDYGNVPKACTPKCECRAVALDGGNRQVKVCTKPTRFRQLQAEQRRQDEADRKARQKDLSDRCGQVLDQVNVFGSRELALLAADACQSLDQSTRKTVLTKYGIKDSAKRSDAIDFEAFASGQPILLLKLAVEALLLSDITRGYGGAPFATWYAGPAPKVEKPSRKGRPKPAAAAPSYEPDGHIAEEITSDFERLQQEYAATESPELVVQAIGLELHELVGEKVPI